jgi:hypothetical protein
MYNLNLPLVFFHLTPVVLVVIFLHLPVLGIRHLCIEIYSHARVLLAVAHKPSSGKKVTGSKGRLVIIVVVPIVLFLLHTIEQPSSLKDIGVEIFSFHAHAHTVLVLPITVSLNRPVFLSSHQAAILRIGSSSSIVSSSIRRLRCHLRRRRSRSRRGLSFFSLGHLVDTGLEGLGDAGRSKPCCPEAGDVKPPRCEQVFGLLEELRLRYTAARGVSGVGGGGVLLLVLLLLLVMLRVGVERGAAGR